MSVLRERLSAWSKAPPQIERIGMEVVETNLGAVRLYRRFGVEEEGRRRVAFRLGERRVDAIVMGLLRMLSNASKPSACLLRMVRHGPFGSTSRFGED